MYDSTLLNSKKCEVQSVDDYRPISLCNEVYKILSNQIKCVSSKQSAFVKGHQIIDNVVIASKCIKSLRYKHKRFFNCAFKLDMSKAFDRLE